MKIFIANRNDSGRTILKFLQKVISDVPNSRMEKLFRKKDIKINGKRISNKNYNIKFGDEIIVYGIISQGLKDYKKAKPSFKVIFEDENILVVDKPTGISIHDEDNCLDNQVLTYLNWKTTSSFTPSHIGRIDKVTSGIVLYGKTYESLRQLKYNQSKFKKIYTYQSDMEKEIETNYIIGHDENKKRMCIHPKGDLTKTKFYKEGSMKLARIYTGKKHQIRVSLAKLGFPINGDVKYGGKKDSRVYLHSYITIIQNLSRDLSYLNGMRFISKPEW
ncbi:MAG: RluA family pseudouridine synthase [Mycoplasma sp.]|nr:RluA family pseudouridine synthase [Mycoplasma sp.]